MAEKALELSSIVLKGKELVAKEGEAALPKFGAKGLPWFAGELYIFVLKLDGTNVVHPLKRYGISRQFDNDFS